MIERNSKEVRIPLNTNGEYTEIEMLKHIQYQKTVLQGALDDKPNEKERFEVTANC